MDEKFNSIEEVEIEIGAIDIKKYMSKKNFEKLIDIWDNISNDVQKEILNSTKSMFNLSKKAVYYMNRYSRNSNKAMVEIYLSAITEVAKPLEKDDLTTEQHGDINKAIVEITKNAKEFYKDNKRYGTIKGVSIAGAICGSAFGIAAVISKAASRNHKKRK